MAAGYAIGIVGDAVSVLTSVWTTKLIANSVCALISMSRGYLSPWCSFSFSLKC